MIGDDHIQNMVEELRAIRRLLDNSPQATVVEGDDVVVEHGGTRDYLGDYYSTGIDAVTIEEDEEWESFDFGFAARTVNVRADNEIVISFGDPNNEGNLIHLSDEETPFAIGGEAALGADGIYVIPAGTGDTNVRIIAY